jgi:hypothetical protein
MILVTRDIVKYPDGVNQVTGHFEDIVSSFDIEVNIGCLLGARLGFSFGQFADFLLGWFGLDIAGDDSPTAAEQARLHEEEKSRLIEENRELREKIPGGDREPPQMKLEEAQRLIEEMNKGK